MFKWTPYPLIRITTALCAGILFGIYQPGLRDFDQLILGLLLTFGVTVLLYFFRRNWRSIKYLIGATSFLSLMIFGCILVEVRTEIKNPGHILHVRDTVIAYEGIIVDHFYEKANSYKTTVSVVQVRTRMGWRKATGKINFYIAKESYHGDVIWGDHIVVKGSPIETSPPSNPHEFNYKRFLTFKNIYHQHYVKSGDWTKASFYDPTVLRYSAMAREYFTEIIKKYVHGVQEQAVSLALVIGVTDGIDNELISAYSASGAMHVLAVSGLHIGIIYWVLLLFLKPFQKTSKGKYIVSFISLLILWSYAFVTGLSSSVFRAVVMFSFVAIARALNRKSNIYNTLAGSAFILLLIDPYLIMSVGFQLSYLAVLGIIWIQRPLYQLYEAPNKVVDWIWSITCVSIAAQATTFSLGLLYFHQFPTYFLFSNLFVIPISFGVLVDGILLIVVSWSESLSLVVGWILEKLSWILNESVFLVEDLPLSIVTDIYIDVFQSWLILGILSCIIFIFQFKQIKWLYVTAALSVMLTTARWIHLSDKKGLKQFIVYNVSGSTAFEIMDGTQSFFLADSTLLSDNEKIRFHIRGNRLFNMVSQTTAHKLSVKNDSLPLVKYFNNSFLIINRPIQSIPLNIKPDYIILSKCELRKIAELLDQFPKATVILDGTCSSWYYKSLKSRLKEKSAKVFSVADKGAFIKEL